MEYPEELYWKVYFLEEKFICSYLSVLLTLIEHQIAPMNVQVAWKIILATPNS